MEGVLPLLHPIVILMPAGIITGWLIVDIRRSRRRIARMRAEGLARTAAITQQFEHLRLSLEALTTTSDRTRRAALATLNAYQRQEQEAAARARALLAEHLTDEQLEKYERDYHIHVTGSEGGRYRLSGGQVLGISKETGLPVSSYCIGPAYSDRHLSPMPYFPRDDITLANMLMIQYNEKEFKRTAVRSRF